MSIRPAIKVAAPPRAAPAYCLPRRIRMTTDLAGRSGATPTSTTTVPRSMSRWVVVSRKTSSNGPQYFEPRSCTRKRKGAFPSVALLRDGETRVSGECVVNNEICSLPGRLTKRSGRAPSVRIEPPEVQRAKHPGTFVTPA